MLLALDTSANAVSVALLESGKVLIASETLLERGQGEALFPALEELLRLAGRQRQHLKAVAAAVGPGSFTGVRIGIATARALSLALGIPARGVSNFEAAAYGIAEPVWVVLDTKRGDFYTQFFKDGKAAGAPLIQTAEQLSARLPLTAAGNGVEALFERIGCAVRQSPTANAAARVGLIACARKGKAQALEPLYLRDADVTLKSS